MQAADDTLPWCLETTDKADMGGVCGPQYVTERNVPA